MPASASRLPRSIIISAPSGAGKTTIVNHLLEAQPRLAFSISATTRAPRPGEQHGEDYYFLSQEAFRQSIQEDAFVEYEQVYEGRYYGTLRSELERIRQAGGFPLFDVDVKGGLRLKELFGTKGLSIYIRPPSLEELQRRLERRGESPEEIKKRLSRAEYELQQATAFDAIVLNDKLEEAVQQVVKEVNQFIGKE